MANITKEFLEIALGQPIENFEYSSGSSVGEGFTSSLYSIDVTMASNQEVKHLLLKCFPVSAFHQEWVITRNIFQKELLVYQILIPALVQLQHEVNPGRKVIKPPFPELVYGRAINYNTIPPEESKLCSDQLDNCIIMPNLHKTGGFKVANRLTGYDIEHCKLVTAGQAKFHALSWAYKVKSKVSKLSSKFPFLNEASFFDTLEDHMVDTMYDHSLNLFKTVIETCAENDEEKRNLTDAIELVRKKIMEIAALYFCDIKTVKNTKTTKDNILRVAGQRRENEEPWLVATHGDTWLNNMLFRYNEETGNPVEVLFVDLQLAREGDPMTDLVYAIYTSTESSLRKQHLNDILNIYLQSFTEVCNHFNVPVLPQMDLVELKRQYHRAKLFGFIMAFMTLPQFLNDSKCTDGENKSAEGAPQNEFNKEILNMTCAVAGSERFNKRVIELLRELYDEGII